MLLQLGYLGLAIAMTIVLLYLAYKAHGRIPISAIIFLFAWHTYIYLLSLSGFIQNLDFPPRFALLTILPAFIGIGWFAYRSRNSKWLQGIPAHWLIFYQTFRIFIETLFIITVNRGLLHPNVTLHGYNYDFVFALTAILIGMLVWKGNLKIGLIWNYLGLLVIAFIIFLFQTTIYLPEIYGPNIDEFPIAFLQYPFLVVPAFLMPSAVFIHVLSILQLRQKIKDIPNQKTPA